MAPEDTYHLLGKMGVEAGYPGPLLDQNQQEKNVLGLGYNEGRSAEAECVPSEGSRERAEKGSEPKALQRQPGITHARDSERGEHSVETQGTHAIGSF